MKIVVCMKQVPASSKVDIDPETGAMKRMSGETRTNPYDLFALETALQIREKVGGTVTVLTMGPPQAEEMMRDAYTMDLIICGRQTTDGDTAQVGPAIAEHLTIPHAAWVAEIVDVNEKAIQVRQDLVSVSQISEIPYPCLLTIDKDTCVPRLPSYLLKKATADRPIRILSFENMPDQDLSRYGLVGSPTSVERMFAPPEGEKQVYLEGSAKEKAEELFSILTGKKII